ncbi:MAG: hypothetical protein AAFW73_16980 [Bacteroidota bacterium]
MKHTYKVDFLPANYEHKYSLGKIKRPQKGLDLSKNLEALLLERAREGYRLREMIAYQRTDPITSKSIDGYLVVFEAATV